MMIFCQYNFNLYFNALEGFEDLKRDCQDKVKEMENNANRLKMQLRSSQAQLEQTRKALKTVEGSDGHGNYGMNIPKIPHICFLAGRFL